MFVIGNNQWITYEIDEYRAILFIDVTFRRFLDEQPLCIADVNAYCRNFLQIIDEIQLVTVEHRLKQVCFIDLEYVRMEQVRPLVILKLVSNVYNHTKDNILLYKIIIKNNSGRFVRTLVQTCKIFLPGYIGDMIVLKKKKT